MTSKVIPEPDPYKDQPPVAQPVNNDPWPKLEDWTGDVQSAIQIMAAQNLAKAVFEIKKQLEEDLENNKLFEEPDSYNAVFGYKTALQAALTASGIKHG